MSRSTFLLVLLASVVVGASVQRLVGAGPPPAQNEKCCQFGSNYLVLAECNGCQEINLIFESYYVPPLNTGDDCTSSPDPSANCETANRVCFSGTVNIWANTTCNGVPYSTYEQTLEERQCAAGDGTATCD